MNNVKKNKLVDLYSSDSKYTIDAIFASFKPSVYKVFFISFFINLLTIALPLIVMFLLDGKFNLNFNSDGMFNIVFLISVLAFNFIFRYVRASMINFILFTIDKNVCTNIFDKIFKMPAKQMEKKKTSFWNTLFSDIDVIRNGLTGSYVTNIFDIPFVLLFMAVIGILLGKYFFIVIIFLFIYSLFMLFSSYILGVVDNKEKIAIKERDDLVASSLQNLSSLKTLSLTDKIKSMWIDYQNSIIDITYKRNYTLDICLVLSFILFFLGIISFSLIGVKFVALGHISIGALFAIILLFSLTFFIIDAFLKFLPQYFKFINSMERLGQVMVEQVEAFKTETIEEVSIANIVLQNFSIEDTLKNNILDKVNFSFSDNNIYIIKGKNSFDVSLILKSFIGAYELSSGNVLFDKYDVSLVKPQSLKNYIHYAGETSFIIDGTVKENLNTFISDFDDDTSFAGFSDYKKVASILGLDAIITKLPNSYNTIIDNKTDLLSQEELKLLTIARVFVGAPRVMIFDQPFLGLRDLYKQKIIEAFKSFSNDRIIIISTMENNIPNATILSIENGIFVEKKIDALDFENSGVNRALFRRILKK